MLKSSRNIRDLSDLEDECNHIFESFLESIINDPRFVRPIGDYDFVDEDSGIEFIYTNRGSTLAERMRDRLHDVIEHNFPDTSFDAEIQSHLFVEY